MRVAFGVPKPCRCLVMVYIFLYRIKDQNRYVAMCSQPLNGNRYLNTDLNNSIRNSTDSKKDNLPLGDHFHPVLLLEGY